MNYKDRLDNFNKSKKYWSEVHFLRGLLRPESKRVLDYGCGTGFCAKVLRMVGFDVEGYDQNEWGAFDYKQPSGSYNEIYLMHSIAHLESPLKTILALKAYLSSEGRLIIITPNQEWLHQIRTPENYKPDPTVVQHFSQYKLEQLITDAELKIVNSGQFGERVGNFNERIFIVAE